MSDVTLQEDTDLVNIEKALEELGVHSTRYNRVPGPTLGSLPGTAPSSKPAIDRAAGQEAIMEFAKPAEIPPEVDAFTKGVRNLGTGIKLGLIGEVETFNHLAKLFSKATGMPETDALQKLIDWGKPTEAEIAAGGDSLFNKVTRSVGQALPLIAQLFIGSGVISAGLKAAKLPTILKLGAKVGGAGGKRLMTAERLAHAQGLAKAGGKTIKGAVPIAEPLAFGLYEGTHEAVHPDASILSTLGKTGEGLFMGTALPLFRGLPHIAREAAPAALAGGMTLAAGGSPEDAMVSGITMGTLAGLPEAAKVSKRLFGKGQDLLPEPEAPKIMDVSEAAKAATGNTLDSILDKAGYARESFQNWSLWQKQKVLSHTFKTRQGKLEALPTEFDPGTGTVTIKFGDIAVPIPKQNPNVKQVAPTPTPTPQPAKEEAMSLKETGEIEKLSEQELLGRAAYGADRDSRLEAMAELERRRTAVEVARRRTVFEGEDGPFTGAMKYIREVLGDKKEITASEVGDIIEKNLINTGYAPTDAVLAFSDFLSKKGYKIVARRGVPTEETDAAALDKAVEELMQGTEKELGGLKEPTPEPTGEPPELPSGLREYFGAKSTSVESPLQKAKRMREEADRFLAEQKAEEEMGGPEIGTKAGVRALQREAIGGVKGKTLRAGVKTSVTGGLRGRIDESLSSTENKRILVPKTSDSAFKRGKELRQLKDFATVDRLWTDYKAELKAFAEASPEERKSPEFKKRLVENPMRKEVVETYLDPKKTKSMGIERIDAKLAEQRPTMQPKPTKAPKEAPKRVWGQTKTEGLIVKLYKKNHLGQPESTDLENRAKLIVEAGKIEPKWHKGALRDFSDEALDLIVKHKIPPTRTWVPDKAKKAVQALGRPAEEATEVHARIPSGVEPAIQAGNLEVILDHLRTLGFSKSLINSVDWEKVMQLRNEGFRMEEIPTRGQVPIEKVAYGDLALEKGVGDLSPSEKFTIAEGWTDVDPEFFVGPMIQLVLEGKGMSFKEAMRKIRAGKPIPKAPEGVYKGYEPPPHKIHGVSQETLGDWFENALTKVAGEDPLRESYAPEVEERIIREAVPGLRVTLQEDMQTKTAAGELMARILKLFRTNRKVENFGPAAKRAFVEGWGSMKFSGEEAKSKLRRNVMETIEEDALDLSTEEAGLGPGGKKYVPGKKDPTLAKMDATIDALHSTERDFMKAGSTQQMGPKTEADRLLDEANKMTDTFRNYKDIMDMAAKNHAELKEVSKEIWKTKADRESMVDATPEALAPIDTKLSDLKNRRGQLLVDIEYLMSIKDWFARSGKPFTGTEVYLENELNERQHGINGTVISKAAPKGSTFYIIQNQAGGPGVPGATGHQIYAKAEIVARKTKGDIVTWEVPENMDPRAEDVLYNDILERYLWRTTPIAIKNLKGVAERVASRRVDDKYKIHKASLSPDQEIMALLPEDSKAFHIMKQKIHNELVQIARDAEGKTMGPLTREKKMRFLERARSLGDEQIGYDLEMLYRKPTELGISDPHWSTSKVEYVPLIERIVAGDPTQSRIAPIAYVGNLAEQAQISIANYMRQYKDMADEHLGKFRTDPIAKQKILRHLIAKGDPKIRAKHPDWISAETEIIDAARGYRLIMEDIAQLFNLREKGLYRENYATINYDIAKIWDMYAKKFAATSKASELPDSLLSKIDPANYKTLRDYAISGKGWDALDPTDQTFIMDKFFKYNSAYSAWEQLPEIARASVPKQKFIKYFQHRTLDEVMDFALNEDIWDVTTNYIRHVVHDGVMSDFFLPNARRVVRNIPALSMGETSSVRGYLDNYIRQVAGFNRNTPATVFLDSLAKTFNKWMGKPILPESGMTAEVANIYQQWLYRGALGIDTAMRNLTQSIYTVAELGAHNWFKGLRGYVEHRFKKDDAWKKFDSHRRLIEEFFEEQTEMFRKSNPSLYDKWRRMDQRVTSLALSPMRMTEHVNRGIAYFAGLAEAAKDNLNFNAAHIVGLKRATQYTHPFEMSEIEWRAVNKMYKTQFGYGKVHQAPIFNGPAMSFFKPFLTFPTRSLNFVSNMGKEALGIERWGEAVGKGSKEIWMTSEKGKMFRFLALSGFMAFAPQLIASTLGIDTGYLWGKGLFPNQMTPMWMGMAEDFYVGVLGGQGMDIPPDEKDKMKARQRLGNSSLMLLIPQWRFARKTGNVMDNIERGYHAMGPKELGAKETTFMKEMINLLGFPPYTKDAKQLVWDANRANANMAIQKQTTLKEAAAKYDKKDFAGATKILNSAYAKYGLMIAEQDIKDYIQYQEKTSAYEAAYKSLSAPLKQTIGKELLQAERKYLPHGVGNRSFWVNNIQESAPAAPVPEEEENEISDLYTLMALSEPSAGPLSTMLGEE